MANRVYRGCPIPINHNSIMPLLIELDMVDFYVILRMYWLRACYALVYCSTRVLKFKVPNELVLKRKSS